MVSADYGQYILFKQDINIIYNIFFKIMLFNSQPIGDRNVFQEHPDQPAPHWMMVQMT